MKKSILMTIIFCIISCSSINDKVEIMQADYTKIDKDRYLNIISKQLEEINYKNKDEFINLFSKLYVENEEKISIQYSNPLAYYMLEDFIIDDEIMKEIYALETYSSIMLNYMSLLELKRTDLFNSRNDAWLSKTSKATYLSDEIFFALNILSEQNREAEEVIEDMKIKFPDYPLNKYNTLIYKNAKGDNNVDAKYFYEARYDIRKINSNFYPELEKYKIKLLMSIDLLQAYYYYTKGDSQSLIKLKEEIEKSDLKEKIDFQRINKYIQSRLEILNRQE